MDHPGPEKKKILKNLMSPVDFKVRLPDGKATYSLYLTLDFSMKFSLFLLKFYIGGFPAGQVLSNAGLPEKVSGRHDKVLQWRVLISGTSRSFNHSSITDFDSLSQHDPCLAISGGEKWQLT